MNNTGQKMRDSCELKDMYLPGTLTGNRLPSFDSASDAFESCKSGNHFYSQLHTNRIFNS